MLAASCGSATVRPHRVPLTRPVATTTTTTAPFVVQTCGNFTSDDDTKPGVDLVADLLGQADVPDDLTATAPDRTGTAPGPFLAPVPSSVPVAQANFAAPTPTGGAFGSSATFGVAENLGEVADATLAAQLAARVSQAVEGCAGGGETLALPGSVPGLVVTETAGQQSNGAERFATTIAAKGPYLVNLTWTSTVSYSASGGPEPTLTALPDLEEIAAVADAALGHLPS